MRFYNCPQHNAAVRVTHAPPRAHATTGIFLISGKRAVPGYKVGIYRPVALINSIIDKFQTIQSADSSSLH